MSTKPLLLQLQLLGRWFVKISKHLSNHKMFVYNLNKLNFKEKMNSLKIKTFVLLV